MLDSAVGFTLILLRSFEGVGLEGGAGCGGDRGKELFWSAWLYKQVWKLGSTYSVLGINSRLKIFTLDHHGELLVDGGMKAAFKLSSVTQENGMKYWTILLLRTR
jgi:hypothetical protein